MFILSWRECQFLSSDQEDSYKIIFHIKEHFGK